MTLNLAFYLIISAWTILAFQLSRSGGARYVSVSVIYSLPAITSLYIGIAFNYLGRENFDISFNAIFVIFLMTTLPVIMGIVGIKLFRIKQCNLLQIEKEGLELKNDLIQYKNEILYIYLFVWLYVLYNQFSTGFYLREYYTNSILNNQMFLLTLGYTVGLLGYLIFLIEKRYLYALILGLSLLLFGKKHPLAYTMVLPLMWQIYNCKISLRKAMLFVVAILILLYLSASGFTDVEDVTIIHQLASTFDYPLNFNNFINNFELGKLEGQIFIESFYKLVPREIWTDKPIVYGFLRIHEILFANELSAGFTPSVFETYATWLADYSYFGIVFYSLIGGILLTMSSSSAIKFRIRFLLILYMFDIYILVSFLLMYSISLFKKVSLVVMKG